MGSQYLPGISQPIVTPVPVLNPSSGLCGHVCGSHTYMYMYIHTHTRIYIHTYAKHIHKIINKFRNRKAKITLFSVDTN